MSELKAFNSNRIYWAVEQVERVAGDIDTLHLDDSQFYLKSEADKVIAEKDKEIQRLENLCESYRIDCDNLAIREANAYKEVERNNKQLRHNKYERCLANAKYWIAVGYQCVDDKHRQRAKKHRYKWLELAKQFKEAK